MTIDSTRAHEGTRAAAAGVHRAGTKSGHSGVAGAPAESGFASVMGVLAAAEDSGEVSDATSTSGAVLPDSDVASVVSDTLVPGLNATVSGADALGSLKHDVEKYDKKLPLAPENNRLVAINSISLATSVYASATSQEAPDAASALAASAVAPSSGKAPANHGSGWRRASDQADTALTNRPDTELSVNGHDAPSDVITLLKDRLTNANPVSLAVAVPLVSTEVPVATLPSAAPSVVAQAAGKASVIQAADKWRPSDKSDAALTIASSAEASTKGHGAVSDASTVFNSRPANVLTGVSHVQAELREVRTQQLAQLSAAAPDLSRMAAAMTSAIVAPNPTERTTGKHQSSTTGAGMEGLLGTALADKLGISPTYEVAPTTAVVPDTQVAETVSYWATHGVQSAELTLDGLGHEPVEVRISVDGDQAQVDFRTNQPEVRQVLESASAQLKEMLSSEGLQLTGMSIGTSGRGQTPGDGGQPRPSATRQTKIVSLEPVTIPRTRGANPSVGRALDLYV